MSGKQRYEYSVYDSNSNYELVIAHSYEVVEGYVNFTSINHGFVSSFYKPVSVVLVGEYNEKA